MAKWVDVGPALDFPPGQAKTVRVERVPVAVCNIEGKHLAFADVCPHAGMPLAQGELCGSTIICPFHGYAYNVEDGRNVDFPDQEAPLRTFPVRQDENGTLQVNLQPDTPGT